MRWIRILLRWTLGVLVALVVLVAGSIVVDAAVGRGRIDDLTNTTIDNANGPAVRAYVAAPEGAGSYPAVIMIHEWWGLQEEINGKAEALAEEGYVVVAPDTYRGAVTNWIPRAAYQSLRTPTERVNADLDTVYQWLAEQPNVDPARIAVMGFCYGGGKALRYGLHNSGVAAVGVFYGDPITEPAQLQQLGHTPVLGIFGTADQQIPVSEVEAFERALTDAGVPNQISLYEGQPHAFVGSVEEIRAGGAEGRAWSEFVTFMNEWLQRDST